MSKQLSPTRQLYESLECAYQHFNRTLFEDKLPEVVFTTQRQKNVMGYFSPGRWLSTGNDGDNRAAHELAINPAYIASHPLIEMLQTIVHESCHIMQHEYGTPSRTGYHNKEFASIMEGVGLMPSTTGRPGGKKTGQQMNDYPIPNGKFILECENLVSDGFVFPWVDVRVVVPKRDIQSESDRMTLELTSCGIETSAVDKLTTNVKEIFGDEFTSEEAQSTAKKKTAYTCVKCNFKVYGKPNLRLGCLSCNEELNSGM